MAAERKMNPEFLRPRLEDSRFDAHTLPHELLRMEAETCGELFKEVAA